MAQILYNRVMFSDPKKNVLEFGFIPGQKVVDLASGAGHYSLALSTVLGLTGKVVAVDLNEDILAKLKNESIRSGQDNIEVINGDVQKRNGTKLRDGFADGVVFSNILYQLNDLSGAVEEAKRILKLGGKVCIVEWSDLSVITNKKLSRELAPLTEADSKKLFEKAGFVFERGFGAGEHHYGLILKKPLQ